MSSERAWRDLRLAARALSRARAFSAASVLILAIGVAGTTVMVTLVRGVLLRPLPVRDPAALVVAWQTLPASGFEHYPFGADEIARVAAESRLFVAVGGVDRHAPGREMLVDGDAAVTVDGALVTGAFFDVLGVRPAAGRLLRPADDLDGAEPVLVISHGLFLRRFGGALDTVGRRVTLGERRFTIVGVLPAGLDFPRGADIVRATHSVPLSQAFGDAARQDVDLVARLRAGVSRQAAYQELDALTRRLERERPARPRGLVPVVRPFEEVVVGDAWRPLAALMTAVLLVLIVASVNVANLLLLRADRRRAELAVRRALGAGPWGLLRLWLAESVILCGVATTLGGLAGWWALRALLGVVPPGLPRLDAVRFDGAVVCFLALAWVGTAIALAAAPALLASRTDPLRALGEAPRGSTLGGGRGRRMLVVAQVAIAVTVVAGAGVLLRTFDDANRIDPGLSAERLVFADLSMPTGEQADRVRHAQLLADLSARLEARAGIAAVTPVNMLPYDANGWDAPAFTVEGQDAVTAAANPALNLEAIGPRHFATLGVPIVGGRAFAEADRAGGLAVAIVSEDVARRTWPGRDPLGRRVKFGAPDSNEAWLTIVGVAADVRYRDLRQPRPTIYLPAAQFLDTAERLAVRTTLAPGEVATAVREVLRARGGGVGLLGVTAFDARRAGALVRPRFDALVAGLFALVAWAIAAVGVHAVVAASVAARTRELAIRMAIGATPRNIRALVGSEAAGLVGLGAAIGLGGAVAAGRVLAAQLAGVRALDALTVGAAVGLLVAASALAIAAPLRRAARVDAAEALRR